MQKIRRFLCWCFGFVATLFLLSSLLMAARGLRHTAPPLVVGVSYGLAWWKLKRGETSGRRWAIFASTWLVLSSFLSVYWCASDTSCRDDRASMFILYGLLSAFGIAGLIAFAPRNAMEDMGRIPAAPQIEFQRRPKFKRLVCWNFGILAVALAPLVREVNPLSQGCLLCRMLYTLPLLLVFSCGIAWWTVRRRKASGRLWAVIASTVMLMASMVIGIGELRDAYRAGLHTPPNDVLVLQVILLASGVAGLIAFYPRNAMEHTAPPIDSSA
jgi:uncharacterized membrane protein